MLWRGLRECAEEWEGKERVGQAGVESWLPTLPCCQDHVCVLLGSLFFFLSPFNESNTGPMESGPTESLASQDLVTLLRYLHLLNPVGSCCRPAVGRRGGEELALAAGSTE